MIEVVIAAAKVLQGGLIILIVVWAGVIVFIWIKTRKDK